MEKIDGSEVLGAPLVSDREQFRWYTEGGSRCIVLTHRGRLLEPFPTYGPATYRVLAHNVSLHEAEAYARAHAFTRFRHHPA